MKGAEALLRTLLAGGIDVCFTNPGTSEMQFVAALDRVPEMRAVLTLFEGVATGAADGYARMTGRPAATLLHLGPGLGNGLANFHNAMRARVPIVNIVGDHATTHRHLDAPLTSDIVGYARQVSGWIRSNGHVQAIATDTAAAIAAARQAPGQIATLVTPADCTWLDGAAPAPVAPPAAPASVDESVIMSISAALRSGEPALLLMSGGALLEGPLADAGRIAAATRARVASIPLFPRLARGAGRVTIDRLPYGIDQALQYLQGFRHIILVGAGAPVSFFAYPGKPSWLAPAEAQIHTLAAPEHDLADALARLADAVGAPKVPPTLQELCRAALPTGALTPESIGQAVSALMPEHCIIADEAVTGAAAALVATTGAPPHDWLLTTGGAIGCGMPLAVGAAIACPGRRVLNLQADGSAAYTMQALWTQAREQLDVTTVIYANRVYRILEIEYQQTGAGERAGPQSQRMMSLGQPDLDWVKLSEGMGVPATRADTAESFVAALRRALATSGPSLIEAVL
jgi:acetolactate synthase I/II/III large subunit